MQHSSDPLDRSDAGELDGTAPGAEVPVEVPAKDDLERDEFDDSG